MAGTARARLPVTITRILLVGAGAVGTAAERVLGAAGGVDVTVVERGGDAPLDGVDVVMCALPRGRDVEWIARAVDAGVSVVSAGDDTSAHRELFERVDATARQRGVRVVVGAGVAPGLADVLAKHAAALFDHVDEIRVARVGLAGPASSQVLRASMRDEILEWREGRWRQARRGGNEIVWFPEPIGARECDASDLGAVLLAHEFPTAGIRVRAAPPRVLARLRRDPVERDEWAGVRVEVSGVRSGRHESVVYGAITPCARGAGCVLSTAALGLAGRIPGLLADRAGVGGLAAFADPVPFLAELERRGLTAAVFEGAGRPVGEGAAAP